MTRLCRNVTLAIAGLGVLASAGETGLAAKAAEPATVGTAADAGEPVEPTVDLSKVATNPILALREKSNRADSVNRIKQLALSFHNFEAAHGYLPANTKDKDGKPLLSWRVAILPYIDSERLYNQFKQDEPWDSPHNVKLLEKMPRNFESPRAKVAKKGFTVYQGFAGPGTLLDPDRKVPLSFARVADGTANTILAVEASTAVPWTKPADLPFDPKKELPDFGKAYGNKVIVAFCDGSVRLLNLERVKPETLKHALTVAGGEVLPENWDR